MRFFPVLFFLTFSSAWTSEPGGIYMKKYGYKQPEASRQQQNKGDENQKWNRFLEFFRHRLVTANRKKYAYVK
ncbi:Oidioi.mRNA.OKI2018_I69.chr1.g478.t1.cds [Oikopleura dioica]|uniref:Oidioi.mRNA.OKI2018_I69.chr1.g478.t1.cds n=1 Tax=Oikopleura dioica TaxID=34765 RepID=A0ABN7SS57_OIKDI|nr:Oidioi.mRNA.OKI2018_I69.chr1.g478.t1.cds [Oikopleura dioica]